MRKAVEEDLAIQAAVEDLEGVVEGVDQERPSHSLVGMKESQMSPVEVEAEAEAEAKPEN